MDWFLAALAAVGLPWSLTYSLTHCFVIVLDSNKSKPRKSDGGHEKTWPNQQKDNDKDKYKDKDNENDKHI